MGWKKFLVSIVLFLVIMLLVVWMFFPYNVNDFVVIGPTNFSTIEKSIDDAQFYPRMRFPYKQISYRIIKKY